MVEPTVPARGEEALGELRTLVDEMQSSPGPNPGFDARIASIIGKPAAAYTSCLGKAVGLIPPGWWWHMSHLEVEVIPTTPIPGIPISGGQDYHFNGRPLGYSCLVWGSSETLPAATCVAILLARLGLILKARAKAEGRMYIVQTGQGPRIADRTGKLLDMPTGAWLDDDGNLIAKKDAFPQYHFQEPESEPDEDEDED